MTRTQLAPTTRTTQPDDVQTDRAGPSARVALRRPRAGRARAATRWPSSTSRSLRLALGQLSFAALLVGLVQLAVTPPGNGGTTWWLSFSLVAAAWVYIAAGVAAWVRRPSSRLGALIVAGGFVLEMSALGATGRPVLVAVSEVSATVPLAVLVHILHAFPSGRLRSWPSRCTVYATYAVSIILQAPLYLFAHSPAPYDLLVIDDRPDLLKIGEWVQSLCGTGVVVATVIVLAARLRIAEPRRRHWLAPLYGYGILAVLFIPLSADVLTPWLGWSPLTLNVLQLVDVVGVPLAFTFSLLLGGFAWTGEIEELGTWLGTSHAARGSLSTALRLALGDDSLRLLFWSAEADTYVDENGTESGADRGSDRGRADITLAGERIGALDYDLALNPDPKPVQAAGAVVATSLDRERVSAELRASQHLLRQSRVRIVEAGDAERRRIARDLHDGLQMRLVLLAMQTQQIADDAVLPQQVRAAALDLRMGIDAAAAESRGLVHKVLPAALTEGGLSGAAEDLVDHVPVPVRFQLSLGADALPALVESTAYYVLAEALGNALKHASPSALTVQLTRTGDLLRVEVADDGRGGARLAGGSGLRGLYDRVDTLGGRLHVDSPSGAGTRVVAEVPCVLPG